MQTMKRYVDILNHIFSVAAMLLLIGIVISSMLQVVSRHFSFFKVLGMEELARAQFVWMVSLGMSLGIAEYGHPCVDVLTQKLKGRAKLIHSILIQMAALAFMVLLMYFGARKVLNVLRQSTPLFSIPFKYIYSSLVAGAAGSIVNLVYQIYQSIKKMEGESI